MSDADNRKELADKTAALATKKFGNATPAGMKSLFLSYDVNNDQKINKSELTALLADADVGYPWTRGAWVDGIFEDVDTNNDGLITWEEYAKASGSAPATGTAPSDAGAEAMKKSLLSGLDQDPNASDASKKKTAPVAAPPVATVARTSSGGGSGMLLLGLAVVGGVILLRRKKK